MGLAAFMVKQVLRSVNDKLSQEHIDTAAVLRWWADDAVWDVPAELGPGQTIRGKQAIADWFHAWEEAFPKRRLEVKRVCVNGFYLPGRTSVTVAESTYTETDKGGREYAYDGVTVLQSRNWKIVRATEYVSFAGLPQLATLLQPDTKAQDTVAAH